MESISFLLLPFNMHFNSQFIYGNYLDLYFKNFTEHVSKGYIPH